jgi:hypothetical protein
MNTRNGRAIVGAMIWLAAAYLVLLTGMITFIGAASPPARFDPAFIADPQRFALYRLGFVCASLLAPALWSSWWWRAGPSAPWTSSATPCSGSPPWCCRRGSCDAKGRGAGSGSC